MSQWLAHITFLAEARLSGRLIASFVALGVFGEFDADEPFTKLPAVLEDDRRIADDGRDGGLSFLFSAFNASGPAQRKKSSISYGSQIIKMQ